jgi:hypothetical protein
VVWNDAQTEVWAYLSVDSVVGMRAFFSNPRATLQIDSGTLTAGSAQNLISYRSVQVRRYRDLRSKRWTRGDLQLCLDEPS